MKKAVKWLFCLAMCTVLLTGCGSGPKEYANVWEKVKDTGVLIVGTSPDFAPAEFLDADGNVIGSEVSLMYYLAEQMGVELKIETMDFGAVLTAVDSGKVDLGISGFGWKQDREDNYELSIGFNKETVNVTGCPSNGHGLMVPKDKVDDYKSLEDFNGKIVAAQSASMQLEFTEKQIPGAIIEIVNTLDVGLLSLQTGKVDALAVPCSTGMGFENNNDDVVYSPVTFVVDMGEHDGNIIIAKKGETELIGEVNKILESLEGTGQFQAWYDEAIEQAKELGIPFN
jgi:polar amino acid transport system substrate-binding protein